MSTKLKYHLEFWWSIYALGLVVLIVASILAIALNKIVAQPAAPQHVIIECHVPCSVSTSTLPDVR